jgi:hypothetical protein
MTEHIHFVSIPIGPPDAQEDGYLGFFFNHVVAIFIRSRDVPGETTQPCWYLDTGFGPCDQQGIMFNSLESAGAWIQERLGTGQNQ